MSNNHGTPTPRTILGIGLIAVALLLFFHNIGLKFVGVILSNWPIAFIVAGGIMLHHAKKSDGQQSKTLPFFFIGMGVVFLLAKNHILGLNFGMVFVPLILFFVGMHFLKPNNFWRDNLFSNGQSNKAGESGDEASGDVQEYLASDENDAIKDKPNRIDAFAILGGGDYSTRSQLLSGGSAIAVLGGVEIDIREADSADYDIELDVLAFMGGIEIRVPPHWEVSHKVLPLLGGVSNKSACLADKMNVPKKRLLVTGLAFMGGVDIRN